MQCSAKIRFRQHSPNLDDSKVNALYSNTESKSTIMQVVKTKVKGEEINIMFDSGSVIPSRFSNCASVFD